MSKSKETSARKTIVIVYNRIDGSKWPPYLKKLFDAEFDHTATMISLKDEKITQSTNRNGSSLAHHRPSVLVVILTPEHLKFLKNNTNIDYKQALAANQQVFSPGYSCIILLGIEEKDLKELDKCGQPIEKRFDSYLRWSKFNYSTAENIMNVTSNMFAKIESEILDKSSIKGRIICNTLKCNEEATVAIAFEKELPLKSTAQVFLNFPGNPTNVAVKTEILNPYTVTFTTKEKFEGEAIVIVLINSAEVRLLPSSQIRFVSSANDVFLNSQIYIKFMERMLRRTTMDKKSITSLDEDLAQMFSPEGMMAVPSMAFEAFFGVLVDVTSGTFPHPTILHLTAQYGLEELTSKLIDLPDARLALQMRNSDKKLPEEIARDKGHLDLANFLEGSRITELDDFYMSRMKNLNAFDTDDTILKTQVRHFKSDAVDNQSDTHSGHYLKPTKQLRTKTAPPIPPKSAHPPLKATKSYHSQEGSEFYSQLESVMNKFIEGETNMMETEMTFNKMKFNFKNGCQTFKQKHERTTKMREDFLRAKMNFMPEQERSSIISNRGSLGTSREFLIRKPTSFQITS